MILPEDLPHLRWGLLMLLSDEGGGYWGSDHQLQRQLDKLDLRATLDQVRGALAWLRAQDLVVLQNGQAGTVSAMISQAGLDAAQGRSRVPGVRRPIHLDIDPTRG